MRFEVDSISSLEVIHTLYPLFFCYEDQCFLVFYIKEATQFHQYKSSHLGISHPKKSHLIIAYFTNSDLPRDDTDIGRT